MSLAFSAAWTPAVRPFILACIVCVAAVPVTMLVAPRLGAVAKPTRHRDIHEHPTPRLGGMAMMLGFVVALVAFGGAVDDRWQVIGICAAVTVAMIVDDALHLPPRTKLFLEVGAGGLACLAGMTISLITWPGGHVTELALWASVPITIAWFTGMQVSINLIDGVDGVAAGVVAIVAGVLLLAAVNRLSPTENVQSGVIVMAGALMGCCVGFLVWNFAPARSFMGDSGSHFLGVALAIMSVEGIAKVAVALSLGIPIVALGLPIGDTAWAIVRRRIKGTGIATADAGHIHHRLLDLGLSVRETAITFYLVTGILGCFSLALFGHQHILIVAVVLLSGSLLALVWRNRRRLTEVHDDYLVISGRAAVPSRARHGGEVD